jgi:hypothetical protein
LQNLPVQSSGGGKIQEEPTVFYSVKKKRLTWTDVSSITKNKKEKREAYKRCQKLDRGKNLPLKGIYKSK